MVPCQFYCQVSVSITETDLKQNKWKQSILSNARHTTNLSVTHDPNNYDLGHPKVGKK